MEFDYLDLNVLTSCNSESINSPDFETAPEPDAAAGDMLPLLLSADVPLTGSPASSKWSVEDVPFCMS